MNKNELIEYADYLLKTAMVKVNNIEDAEDLVQETMLAALVAIGQNSKILNHKRYAENLCISFFVSFLRIFQVVACAIKRFVL